MTSLVLFTLGSIASGLAWSAESMIVFRVLQGIGGGLIMPTVMTIMTRKAGPHRMGRVMGILGVPMLDRPDHGADPGRLAGRRRLVAVDLLHQRADRHRRVHPRADRARPRRAPARPPARLARHGPALPRPGRVHLRPRRVIDLRLRVGALVGPDRGRGPADRRLVRAQLAHPQPIDRHPHVRAHARGIRGGVLLPVRDLRVRDDAPGPALLPDGPRPVRARRRTADGSRRLRRDAADAARGQAHRPLRTDVAARDAGCPWSRSG